MPTIQQLVREGSRDELTKQRTPVPNGSPRRGGVCTRVDGQVADLSDVRNLVQTRSRYGAEKEKS